jgi:hypothetical protein
MTAELDSLLREYLSDGRKLKDLNVSQLNAMWRRCAKEGAQLNLTPADKWSILKTFNYIQAELKLRGLEPPPPRGKLDLN